MITLTANAAEQVRNLVAGKPGAVVRLTVEKGGCSGMQYGMSVDRPGADDVVVGENGAQILVDGGLLCGNRGLARDLTQDDDLG